MELSKIAPRYGSRKRRKRVGCGESSGHGKTCCRGGKGQKGRSGATIRPGFEGGQMPLYRRLPKLGFTSQSKVLGKNQYVVVNLSELESFDNGATVDIEALKRNGIRVIANYAGVKVLGTGTISKKLHVKVHAISAAAKAQIEGKGGTVELVK